MSQSPLKIAKAKLAEKQNLLRNAKQNSGKTKKISRRRLAKSILLARIYSDVEKLEKNLVTEDMNHVNESVLKLRSHMS